MKRAMISILILTVLGFWIPCASAENSQDLDPMVSPDVQAIVTGESSAGNMEASQTSNVISTTDTTASEKKVEEPKKKKTKKSSTKKSSSKSSRKHKKSSN